MKDCLIIICGLCSVLGVRLPKVIDNNDNRYEPTWESLDQRPLPKWFDDAKFGIFLHWGVYSVPSLGSEWFWAYWKGQRPKYVQFMKDNYPPGFTYQDFAPQFTAEFFNADEWANLFKKSGARYVVLTSKHHDGYTLWPSKYSFSWNAKDVGPKRDILGELANAVRKVSLKFGAYHSLYEWFNPMYISDKEANFSTSTFMVNKVIPEMIELVQNYEPEVLWSDGDWEATDTYFRSKEFLAWLYNESPVKDTIVVNDRWGKGIPCHHGDFFSCNDRYNPGVIQVHKWENAMTVDKFSWGYRRDATLDDIYTPAELIAILAETVSCGGNLLMNVGPTHDGRIDHIFQERLTQIGRWLSINAEAIYETKPWVHQNDTISKTWYTSKLPIVYAITLEWPQNNALELSYATELFKDTTQVTLLGNADKLKWSKTDKTVKIQMPGKETVASDWAWVLKINN